ncbi:unnamed protein product, partial [Hapterophycus canaliculatus]
ARSSYPIGSGSGNGGSSRSRQRTLRRHTHTNLRCTVTVPDQHALDPTIRDEEVGGEPVDHFRDVAYPQNMARWKKNTKQVRVRHP